MTNENFQRELGESDERVSRKDVLDFVGRYLPILLVCAVVGFVFGVFSLNSREAAFEAEAQILVERNLSPTLRTEVLPDAQLTDVINTEVLLAKATPTIERAVDALDLESREIDSRGTLSKVLGGLIKERALSPRTAWVDRLQRKMSIRPIPDSNIFMITYADPDPEWSADIVNAVLDAYLTQRLEIFRGDKASTVYAAEAEAARSELESLNQRLNEESAGAPVTGAASVQNALASEQGQLVARRMALRTQKGELLETFYEDHPKVQLIDEELASVSSRLARVASEISTIDQKSRRVQQLQVQIQAAENRFLDASSEKNRAELRELQINALTNVRVVFEASPPVRPQTSASFTIAVCTAIGIFFGLCIAFLLQYFREN